MSDKLHPGLTPVKSTMLAGHSYDPATSKLTVQYLDKDGTPGAVWEHHDVPIDKAVTLAGNASPGRYFNERIRGLFVGTRIK